MPVDRPATVRRLRVRPGREFLVVYERCLPSALIAIEREPPPDKIRLVTVASELSIVCHSGLTTEYSCTTVADVDTCEQFLGEPAAWYGTDTTAGDVSERGDSGGPWFFGTTARVPIARGTTGSVPTASTRASAV